MTITQESIQIQYQGSRQDLDSIQNRENIWEIADGIQDKESANGTWMQLQTIQERDQKLESQIYPFNNFQEIKISEFILKIELFKRNQKEKTRLELMKSLL